jgi:3-oxoacyl-[acyl-carrier-protein] synthase III
MSGKVSAADSVGIAGVSYYLPRHAPTLDALARDGLIAGGAEPLATFGFANARVARDESHVEMAVHAARAVLEETGTDPEDIGLVLYAGALASSVGACRGR